MSSSANLPIIGTLGYNLKVSLMNLSKYFISLKSWYEGCLILSVPNKAICSSNAFF